MATYSTAPKSYASTPKVYANVLRNYASGPTSGINTPAQVMAPHLSQPIPLDPDLITAYKEFLTDPQAKQYEQYGADLERVWRASPKASIFQPGYQHNQYVLDRAAAIRAARAPQPQTSSYSTYDSEGSLITPPRYTTDAAGNEVVNPDYNEWLRRRQEGREGSD